MLHESAHVRVSTDDGIGTLRLSPPGGRIGAGVLRELLPAIQAVVDTPGIEILVLRAGTPAGFGRGLEEVSEDLPRLGKRVTNTLAGLPIPTVAFLEGPCIGPGLELALACDFRLAVAGPDTWVSFGEVPPGWGGRVRLRMLGTKLAGRITAREAVWAGVFDHAFCERRAKIELRTWLDRLQFNPRKRATSWRSWCFNTEAGFAAERRAFRGAVLEGMTVPQAPPTARPLQSVGLVGDTPALRFLAAEFAMRRVTVVWVEGTVVGLFAEALRRGRVTPLEADQATNRVRLTHDADALTACDWVTLSDHHTALAGMLERDLPPRTILCVPPAQLERVGLLASRPQRVVGLRVQGETAALTDCEPEVTATVAGWLGMIGVTTETTAVVPAPALV